MASRSINKVVLLGNLTRDPEVKYTPTGAAVCTFGLATNRTWTTAEGQTKEDTQFHRVTAWNKLAELCGKLLSKGKKVYLEGRLSYRNYTGKDGQPKSITEIIMDDFIVFSGAKHESGYEKEEETHQQPTPEEEHTETKEEQVSQSEVINPDDIPF